ncbi:alpha/beta hydrolase [Rhodobacter lacus]|uniref:Alpha/beta hydrolase n=1 Tax=Rhodobacter lacus TaxID=1641972 RepID=A0ABW5A6B3_9RHOB
MTSQIREISPEKRFYMRQRRALRRDLETLAPLFDVETRCYAEQPTETGPVPLAVDLYTPKTGRDWPVLIWLHSGGFTTGTRQAFSHPVVAGHFVRHGYAVAVPDYRLHRQNPLITPQTRALMRKALAETAATEDPMRPLFQRSRAFAVLEDCAALLAWLATEGGPRGLGRQITWGGSSAGAISALNALYLLPELAPSPFAVRSAVVSSGGFAYGSLARPDIAPALALHGPTDSRVPIGSIRALKARLGTALTLIESDSLLHGEIALTPDESFGTAVERLVAFDRAAAARL